MYHLRLEKNIIQANLSPRLLYTFIDIYIIYIYIYIFIYLEIFTFVAFSIRCILARSISNILSADTRSVFLFESFLSLVYVKNIVRSCVCAFYFVSKHFINYGSKIFLITIPVNFFSNPIRHGFIGKKPSYCLF